MPIYDYLCSNCRHLTEVIHGIHDEGPRFCPACGAEGTMRKALSTPTVHFKGSGWAKKDRSSTSSARTKASAASSTSDRGSSEGKSAEGGPAPSSSVSEPSKGSTDSAKSSED
ncbi:MAG: zinc ribbon domain-containing protein [Chloroflexi bacterium]|nr:zinc ribbon domain-containing protein [Chloroflexota bacterium]